MKAITVIPIEGMHCSSCANTIERKLIQIVGVEKASVNFASKKAILQGGFSIQKAIDAIQALGYKALSNQIRSDEKQELEKRRKSVERQIAYVFTGVLFALSMSMVQISGAMMVQALLSVPAFWAGRAFFLRAFKQMFRFEFTMDMLVALGTGSALVLSFLNWVQGSNQFYFEGAAVILCFVLFGKQLEEKATHSATLALQSLLTLNPNRVIRVRKGPSQGIKPLDRIDDNPTLSEEEIDVGEIHIRDQIRLKPGELVGADGFVVEGESTVMESVVTGESVPVIKKKGDRVYQGTLNQEGSVIFEVDKVGGETTLGQIAALVEEAMGQKAPIQQLVDKVSQVFVPSVMVVSVLTLLIWRFLGYSWMEAILPTMAVLVVACPCALGLATPTAVVAGLGRALKMGVLLRGPDAAEKAAKIDMLILDKTGTLTQGIPEVLEVMYLKTRMKEVLPFIAGMEKHSEHVFAKAILRWIEREKIEIKSVEKVRTLVAKGLLFDLTLGNQVESQRVVEKVLMVGTLDLLQEQGVSVESSFESKLDGFRQKGMTVIYCADSSGLLGTFILGDPIRERAAEVMRQLSQQGIHLKIASGDHEKTVQFVAEKIGISDYHSKVTPQGKLDLVKDLQSKGHYVGMVGDGINDAASLAQANVGIAIGTGSQISREVADVVLLDGQIQKIAEMISISHKMNRIIRQNLWGAFIYNLLAIPMAAMGYLNPMFAALLMSLSSVTVVANANRLKLLSKPI